MTASDAYRVLEHGGYVAHFTVELIFDLNAIGDSHELVGITVRCQHCGDRNGGRDLIPSLKAHAATHKPEIAAQCGLDGGCGLDM
jgi:hypothetical protein